MRARIRLINDDKAFITLKSQPGPEMRYEYEYPIPYADAAEMIERFSMEPLIEKIRHCLPLAGLMWSIDVFEGANRGLVLGEVELGRVGQSLDLPPWTANEVTGDTRYGNSSLARTPLFHLGNVAQASIPPRRINMPWLTSRPRHIFGHRRFGGHRRPGFRSKPTSAQNEERSVPPFGTRP
jgi:adenylate cyclase